ncbi:uracil permease, partial [Yersinia pestis]
TNFPKWVQTLFHSGISSTCLMAILLNLLFNHLNLFKNKSTATTEIVAKIPH